MVYSLTYRRPAHVSSSCSSIRGSQKPPSIGDSMASGSTAVSAGIPEALSFDRIISGGTCPPCTTRDFMNYLIYIEHSAENLQFFLWYRYYLKRFSELPQTERGLAPEWTAEKLEASAVTAQAEKNAAGKKVNSHNAAIFKDTDFAQPKLKAPENNPFLNQPVLSPVTSTLEGRESMMPSDYGWDDDRSTLKNSTKVDYKKLAASAYAAADVKVQPFTIQPFREEITRIIGTYITDGGPRQLNLASKERTALLHALAATTHPSAFQAVSHTVLWTLRHQAHPNFIRWAICNGNRPRVIFGRGLGVGGILGGIVLGIILTLSGAHRTWRILAAIPFLIGIATLIAAWKGMCVVLHGMRHRHLRPWELFTDDTDDTSSTYELKNESIDTLAASNSYEDEPWVVRYEKRNVVRKVFDREVWIQEPALRQIQDTIFLQAVLASLLLTAAAVGIFVAIPAVKLF